MRKSILIIHGAKIQFTVDPNDREHVEIEIQSLGFKKNQSSETFYKAFDDAYQTELKNRPLFFRRQKDIFKKIKDEGKHSSRTVIDLLTHAKKEPDGRTTAVFFRMLRDAIKEKISSTVTVIDSVVQLPTDIQKFIPDHKKTNWFQNSQPNLRYTIKERFDWIVTQTEFQVSTIFSLLDSTTDDINDKLKKIEGILASIKKQINALVTYLNDQQLWFAPNEERQKTNRLIHALQEKITPLKDATQKKVTDYITNQIDKRTVTLDQEPSALDNVLTLLKYNKKNNPSGYVNALLKIPQKASPEAIISILMAMPKNQYETQYIQTVIENLTDQQLGEPHNAWMLRNKIDQIIFFPENSHTYEEGRSKDLQKKFAAAIKKLQENLAKNKSAPSAEHLMENELGIVSNANSLNSNKLFEAKEVRSVNSAIIPTNKPTKKQESAASHDNSNENDDEYHGNNPDRTYQSRSSNSAQNLFTTKNFLRPSSKQPSFSGGSEPSPSPRLPAENDNAAIIPSSTSTSSAGSSTFFLLRSASLIDKIPLSQELLLLRITLGNYAMERNNTKNPTRQDQHTAAVALANAIGTDNAITTQKIDEIIKTIDDWMSPKKTNVSKHFDAWISSDLKKYFETAKELFKALKASEAKQPQYSHNIR